ncbi:Expansin [Trema orientale]|uniref:Expansin n=1 Tax=Trema orientale TaxID=63057 RepID=A0A2P5BBB9_TREOI|nr:Expansin [Trema orientale]
MVLHKQHLMILTLVTCLTTAANALEGIATYYKPPYTPSACYEYEYHGVLVAAANDALWNHGNVCGQTYWVTCTGITNNRPQHPCKNHSTVFIEIVDYCKGCNTTINLSEDAFKLIAYPRVGKIKID